MTSSPSELPLHSSPERFWNALATGLSGLGEAWRYEWSRLGPTASYAVRVALSIGFALWIAAFLQLSQPLSAVTTVLIVANPIPGALVSKSVWRIIGTLIGTTLGIGLMAAFPQQPLLFFAGLAIIIGVACCVATLLRFYRAYAAVLSGYTIIIISVGAFADPDRIFTSAMSRLSVVVVGVVCTGIVFQLTTVSRQSSVLIRVDQLLRDVLAQFVILMPGERGIDLDPDAPRPDEPGQDAAFRDMDVSAYSDRARLLAQAGAVIEAIEYAAASDYAISRRAQALQEGVSRLLGMLSAHHATWRALPATDAERVLRARSVSGALMRAVCDVPSETLLHGDASAVMAMVDHALAQLDELVAQAPDLEGLAAIDSERDIVEQLRHALANLSRKAWHERGAHLYPLMEWPAALRNGARGVMVTMLGCLAWYVLHWSSGPSMLVYLIAASCLLATAPSATKAAAMLSSGTIMAIPGSYVFQALLLPRIDGFLLLWASLCVCLLPGIWIQFHPRYAVRGFGYAVFFNTMSEVQNPIRFDDITLLNGWVAFFVAACGLTLVFRTLLPADQRLEAGRLVTGLVRAIQQLATVPIRKRIDWLGWEHIQMQRVLRIAQRLSFAEKGERVFHVTDAALTGVSLGRVVMRVRRLARDQGTSPTERTGVASALRALRSLRRDPTGTAAILREAALALVSQPGASQAQVQHDPMVTSVQGEGVHLIQVKQGNTKRMAACLIQMAQLIDAVPGFFHNRGSLQLAADHPRAGADLRLLPNFRARAA